MDEVVDGWLLGRTMMKDILLIWVVDESGAIWFALEELVYNEVPTGLPRFQTFPLTEHLPKLGHPALVSGQPARIGGEIRYQHDYGNWSINNDSGRYGFHPSRKPVHLKNVKRVFGEEYGIALEETFIPPKEPSSSFGP